MCRRAALKALSVFLRILTSVDRLHLRGGGYFRDPQNMFHRVCIGVEVKVDIYKLRVYLIYCSTPVQCHMVDGERSLDKDICETERDISATLFCLLWRPMFAVGAAVF